MVRMVVGLSKIKRLLLYCGMVALAQPAYAVITIATESNLQWWIPVRLELQIGTPQPNVIDRVRFDVPAQNVGNATLVPASTGGVDALMRIALAGGEQQSMRTTVDSSVGLQCATPASCGSTVIPFSDISWTVTPAPSGQYAQFDWQDGAFTGGATQQLLAFTFTSGNLPFWRRAVVTVASTLNFNYANSTIYPAGRYRGRVTYTTTLL